MKRPEDYKDKCGHIFEPYSSRSYVQIRALPELIGKPWNELALGLVQGLRPSSIRVTSGMETMDARLWRVTVEMGDDNLIAGIRQEVEVGLPDGIEDGHGLKEELKNGLQ